MKGFKCASVFSACSLYLCMLVVVFAQSVKCFETTPGCDEQNPLWFSRALCRSYGVGVRSLPLLCSAGCWSVSGRLGRDDGAITSPHRNAAL